MNETSSPGQRESDNSNSSDDESSVGSYQHYARNGLPEGYIPYRDPGQNVYDRYDSDYETAGQEAKSACTRNESCCKIGWLENL